MIPISDYAGFRRRMPVVNILIVVVNILVFLYEVALPGRALQAFIFEYGIVPCELTGQCSVTPASPQPIYLTILTSMFLHGGWLHIGGNMLYLWVFGDNVEDAMGHLKYLIFYLLCGITAALAQTYVDVSSRVPSIGASGAIAGVLGAYIVLYPGARVRTLLFLGIFVTTATFPALLVIGFWALTQFFTGIASLGVPTYQTGGVAYFAHIGGFVAGLVLVNFFRQR